ncbi:hypothetical protein HS088_TW14G01062 [Tripterygium wilfordii]|uniref:Inosine/uridine-preferring nucleoside hydrolase domain-containing protein n=1 Tax=Tripterygium wilfordii TaxID=458696 RepID=A0A7J7CS24_TRIWF|nr:hypothetical protein HS088_TW14G01062 [Tripterygium wilfordii]
MLLRRNLWVVILLFTGVFAAKQYTVEGLPHRILLDTDVDTDDFFALFYLLKLNRSEFELEALTISANAWTDAGHAVNQIYDILYMMGRDDISVGVGGEGGILADGTILPNVGGYLPIIEQGMTTAGYCRYRQAIPVLGGRLDVNTNYGIRKAFLPQDGYTEEVSGSDSVRVLVATKAKPNQDPNSNLDREFFKSFLDVLNRPQQTGKFNFTTEFPNFRETFYRPDFRGRKLGTPVVFDMDMSAGDFLALFYLLKIPVEVINLMAIIVSPTGWANAATIDVIYDLLHMMGRDDIPVGLGDVFAMNQSDPIFPAVGDCKYVKAIPHGRGGFLDSDTLYGLARNLPRSPRRYTAENSLKHGAPRDTANPELRQPPALEIWESLIQTMDPGSKITLLTNGPLTSLAKIIQSGANASSIIQDVYIVGGHIRNTEMDTGNVITVDYNEYAELNMFLDPIAAKTVFESALNITLIPLGVQRKVGSFSKMLEKMHKTNKTPEALFAHRLLSRLYHLQQTHHRYQHMGTFLGELLGAVILAGDHTLLKPILQVKPIKFFAEGIESKDGETIVEEKQGKLVKVLENVNTVAYYDLFAKQLGVEQQSAVLGSFCEQKKLWSRPNQTVDC